jgi:hypothetical protein
MHGMTGCFSASQRWGGDVSGAVEATPQKQWSIVSSTRNVELCCLELNATGFHKQQGRSL